MHLEWNKKIVPIYQVTNLRFEYPSTLLKIWSVGVIKMIKMKMTIYLKSICAFEKLHVVKIGKCASNSKKRTFFNLVIFSHLPSFFPSILCPHQDAIFKLYRFLYFIPWHFKSWNLKVFERLPYMLIIYNSMIGVIFSFDKNLNR